MLAPGDVVEGHTVVATLGRGGSATVHLVRDDSGATLALKVADRAADAGRLRREFDLADAVRHRHVVRMHRCGDGWFTMDAVVGGSLTGLPTREERLAALPGLAEALDAAHRAGVVHCDVKPANVLLATPAVPDVRLVDFGIAHRLGEEPGHRRTRIEASLPYTAPEVIRGHAPGATTDGYALACLVVELLTGSPPFIARTPTGIIDAQLNRPPPRLSHRYAWLPRAFDSVLVKAMAKDPDERYPTCAEFVRLVVRLVGTRPPHRVS